METLQQSLQNIRGRMYTLDEFPFVKRESLPDTILPEVAGLDEKALKARAFLLTGRELDALLLDLAGCRGPLSIEAGTKLLRYRFSPRVLKLMTRLYQYNMDSPGLAVAAREMVGEAKVRNHYPKEGLFLFRFGEAEDPAEALIAVLAEDGGNIDGFCSHYAIDPDSPLAQKSFLLYLIRGTREALLLNKKWLLQYLEREEPEVLTPLIENYLNTFALAEFSRSVNLMIRDRLGEPHESPLWEPYTGKEREVFAQWSFLHELKVHSVDYPEKYRVLSSYYDQIISCKLTPDQQILVIDFGVMVILDPADRPYSFYCRRTFYEEQMRQHEDSTHWLLSAMEKKGPIVTARDFIIENREDKCMRITYEGIESLYINEMLDIKMGLEPDMRNQAAGSWRSS